VNEIKKAVEAKVKKSVVVPQFLKSTSRFSSSVIPASPASQNAAAASRYT